MKSEQFYNRSKELTPGGVSSPVRAFAPYPLFIKKAKGCRITDADDNEYLDLCMSYGPLITGHAHPEVIEAAKKQIELGTVYGAPSEVELDLIQKIHDQIPSAEMVRLANTGTEATMHAIRLARGFTGRDNIVKINGGFHGAHDSVLVNAGSGSAGGVPSSRGVPADTAKHTFTMEYNNIDSLIAILEKHKDIACVIMEPVMGNTGVVTPENHFLQEVRDVTRENDVLLIFDEVINGFRISDGGAQKYFGVTPDMSTFGKIVGGGFPAGAFVGRKDIMQNVAPQGNVYVAGTFAGNPVSAAAGLAQINVMMSDNNYQKLNDRTAGLVSALRDMMTDAKVDGCVNSIASMFSVFFGVGGVSNGTEAMQTDRRMFDRLFRSMLKKGVYLPPSALEVDFMSIAHDDEAVKQFEEAFGASLKDVKE